jgi:hypothetical protein
MTLATGTSSSVVLSLKERDYWILRIDQNSQVNIDQLMKDYSVFYLMKGGLTLTMKTPSGAVKRLDVRTKFASFSVKGTTIAVLTDGEKRSLMSVHDGMVEAENFKMMEKTRVPEGFSYLVNLDGEKKIDLNLGAIDLYPWNPEDLEKELPELETVVEKIGDIGPTLNDAEKKKLEDLKDIDQAIELFETQNQSLFHELENLKENAKASREGYLAEKVKVDKDIRCLQTSPYECNLFNDKILYQRGFPRMWGTPRYRSGLVVGLQKYLQERNDEVTRREEDAKILADLMKKRDAVLSAVKTRRAGESELSSILPALQDERLRR